METISALSASGSRYDPNSLAMPSRLARKPSTASLTPAARNSRKAKSISPDAIGPTMTGTSKIRAIVIKFGRVKPGPEPRPIPKLVDTDAASSIEPRQPTHQHVHG